MTALLIVASIVGYLLIGSAVMGVAMALCTDPCRGPEEHWGWVLFWGPVAVGAPIAQVPYEVIWCGAALATVVARGLVRNTDYPRPKLPKHVYVAGWIGEEFL